MRTICILALLCAVGFPQAEGPAPAGTPPGEKGLPVILDDLVHVDPSSSEFQHPLVCGTGRDFPTGREFAFKNTRSGEFVHAVFPEGVKPPENPDGKLILHGQYQAIQKKESYTLKQPPDDYRYFVVSSWERK